MWTTAAVLRLVASAQLLWLAFVVARGNGRDRSARATIFFLVCCVAHTLLPPVVTGGFPAPAVDLVAALALLMPVSFWLLAKVHFDDDFRPTAVHGLALAAYLLLGHACWRASTGRWPIGLVPDGDVVFRLVPRLLGLTLLVHALLTIYVGARSDLVVSRVKLRYRCLWASGTYIFIELLGEAILLESPAESTADLVNAVATFAIVFVITAAAVNVRPEVLRPRTAEPEASAPVLDPRLAGQLRQLVEEEQVFRQEGLTIGGLAERLSTHEYKVRELINDQLGFRNFNAFLNHYRIREAQRRLTDPDARRLNVAEVAYEVGYRSLGPFNKAFKDSTGLTPTEFRAARTAASAPETAARVRRPVNTNDPDAEPA